MQHEPAQTLMLARGADHLWRAAAGTELAVLGGAVALTELCRPLAGRVISPCVQLGAARPQHRVAAAGWVRMTALTDAELRVSEPARVSLAGFARACRRMMASLLHATRIARA